MNRSLLALCVTAALGVCASVAAPLAPPPAIVGPISKDQYASISKQAEVQYKLDKTSCGSLSGNAKDICMAEAKGKESVTRAEAKAAYENTPKSREAARLALTEANYSVAKEECDDKAGNTKDVCVKEATSQYVAGKAEAKVDRVNTETRNEGAAKRADARSEAHDATVQAEYKVALEKCDAYAGAAKSECVAKAKAQFGKS